MQIKMSGPAAQHQSSRTVWSAFRLSRLRRIMMPEMTWGLPVDKNSEDCRCREGVEPNSDSGDQAADTGRRALEKRFFVVFAALMTALFLWMLKPFFGAIFWACALTVMFFPLQRRMVGWMRGRQTLAALATLAVMCGIVVVPAVFIIVSFVNQGTDLYKYLSADGWAPARDMFEKLAAILPPVAAGWLKDSGFASFDQILQQLPEIAGALAGGVASNALKVVQGSFGFLLNLGLMLYLVFVMLVSGPSLVEKLVRALPLGDARERLVIAKFGEVVRATLKGSVVVAAVQGTLGGLIFLVLGAPSPFFWGVVMAMLSLIPVVGSGVVWGPYAVYLIASGHPIRGIILAVFGVVVIGLADNILRPILVGRETRMPDFLVLLSTIGGLAVFGVNGFMIGPLVAALFLAVWDIFEKENV